jgi:hypothetical protein
MASASQLRALLQSHGSGDDERFYAAALQVAAAEARRGHDRLAKEIRTLVEGAKLEKTNRKATASIVQLARPQGEAADLLEEVHNDCRIEDPKLRAQLAHRKMITLRQTHKSLFLFHW